MHPMKKALRTVEVLDDEPGGLPPDLFIQNDWRLDHYHSIKSVDDLSKHLPLLSPKEDLAKVTDAYHMRISQYYLSLIQNPTDPRDPIRMQCVPSMDEITVQEQERVDPLGEESMSPIPCLVHRYPDRVLLLVTDRCFMYCRHCTRKRLWKNKFTGLSVRDIEMAVHYLCQNKQIREVVVSGGDPLVLSSSKLDFILSSLSRVENIEVIRIGTRAPVVMPQRVDETLCQVLSKYPNLWINVQFNHPREITPQSTEACRKLQACGIPMSNQSVLLRGINDTPEIMKQLCQKLQSIRVRPYYLYQCDPVVGATHFRTSIWEGIEIIEKMRGHTGGMCVPTFVVDGVEGKGKIPLGPNYLVSMGPDQVVLRNYKNEYFTYFNPQS